MGEDLLCRDHKLELFRLALAVDLAELVFPLPLWYLGRLFPQQQPSHIDETREIYKCKLFYRTITSLRGLLYFANLRPSRFYYRSVHTQGFR